MSRIAHCRNAAAIGPAALHLRRAALPEEKPKGEIMQCPIDNETLVMADRGGVEIDYGWRGCGVGVTENSQLKNQRI